MAVRYNQGEHTVTRTCFVCFHSVQAFCRGSSSRIFLTFCMSSSERASSDIYEGGHFNQPRRPTCTRSTSDCSFRRSSTLRLTYWTMGASSTLSPCLWDCGCAKAVLVLVKARDSLSCRKAGRNIDERSRRWMDRWRKARMSRAPPSRSGL